MSKNFYITTTLPYVNAPLHMGHALEFVRADAIARYKTLIGYDVYFNTGTDEHGTKILEKAREAGMDVQDFVDAGFLNFKKQIAMFGVSDSVHFIRTTDKKHEELAQEFWKKVDQAGYIYKKNYEAKYCVGCESEKTDSELNDMGFCPDHDGVPLQIISEENYFFKYSAFTDKLLEFYDKNPNFIVPDFRYNEMKAFVARGLQDFSISRLKSKMPWGIPVPGDSEHVMYVWFDALTNYINTFGGDENLFEKYWIGGTPTQYCGKDNTRFQGAMWQAMLMAGGFPNSHRVIVNGFITADGGVKMSKTLGNVVDPKEIVDEYGPSLNGDIRAGTDALRYFLLREISSFEDSPFSKERFKDAYNSGLANGLGNLASRILTLSEKYLDGCPETFTNSMQKVFFNHLEKFDIKQATDFVWAEIQNVDKIIQTTEPFKIVKSDLGEGKKLISDLVVRLHSIAEMLNPVMPETSEKILKLIRANKKPEQPLFLRKE